MFVSSIHDIFIETWQNKIYKYLKSIPFSVVTFVLSDTHISPSWQTGMFSPLDSSVSPTRFQFFTIVVNSSNGTSYMTILKETAITTVVSFMFKVNLNWPNSFNCVSLPDVQAYNVNHHHHHHHHHHHRHRHYYYYYYY